MSQWAGSMDSGAIGVPRRVGPFEALARGVRGSFQTRGRSSRSEYWWFQLFLVLFFVLAFAIDAWRGWSAAALLVAVLVSLPASISVCVRRLHDAGYSGGYFFVQYLPFIGSIWLLVLTVQPSKRLQNEYGPGPDDVLLH